MLARHDDIWEELVKLLAPAMKNTSLITEAHWETDQDDSFEQGGAMDAGKLGSNLSRHQPLETQHVNRLLMRNREAHSIHRHGLLWCLRRMENFSAWT